MWYKILFTAIHLTIALHESLNELNRIYFESFDRFQRLSAPFISLVSLLPCIDLIHFNRPTYSADRIYEQNKTQC
jgi:hypothetical protein